MSSFVETTLGGKKIDAREIGDIVEFGKELGRGGFGSVYQGILKRDIVSPAGETIPKGRKVAVKEQTIKNNDNMEQIATEINALKKAMAGNCSDVYQIYEILFKEDPRQDTQGTLYLIVELVQGPRLDELEVDDEWSEERILMQIIDPLRRGLQCLHENGIVHRDIKMQNIMFDSRQNKAKLIDLGVSCIQQCKDLKGTLGTMAPEILYNKMKMGDDHIDEADLPLETWKKADYWSLGVTLFALLTKTTYPVQQKVQNRKNFDQEDVKMASKIMEGFSKLPRIRKLLEGLLSTNPETRTMSDAPASHKSQTLPEANLRQILKAFKDILSEDFDMGLIDEDASAEDLVQEFLQTHPHYKNIDAATKDTLNEQAANFLTNLPR